MDNDVHAPQRAHPVKERASPPQTPPRNHRLSRPSPALPGLALTLLVGAAATGLGNTLPLVGAPVCGIALGALLAVLHRPGPRLSPGITFASRRVLQAAIVVLGCQLSLAQVLHVGTASLPVMLGTLGTCLLAACWLGRALRITGDLRTLIGVGTGVCGASAIAAITPVITAASSDVAYAVSTIFLFNIAAVLTFPLLGHLLAMGPHAFGLFAGTAVNDMSSVVATATAYGPAATGYAVVVKLTRTLLIIPICLALAARARRHRHPVTHRAPVADPARLRVSRLVPWFLTGFLLTATANTAHVIPAPCQPVLNQVAHFLITIALSAVGLSTDLTSLRRAGPPPTHPRRQPVDHRHHHQHHPAIADLTRIGGHC
ncbi:MULTISPECIES: YeiH family protein [Streptacidiphilus]|uniref:YeiH family protein n=1 Tax=Streptacidiphilus cavernicola TaxID=3342716 RepID=A0ABV6UP60_9ACTN|nr:putative sulfate exporter family transporter [Streptacidiphilus jeojiense]